jgi:hypothetical protein
VVARRTAVTLALLLGWLMPACELLPPCEDLEVTLGQSEEGLVITPSEHPDGWGRADCEACHVLQVVHQRECSDGVDYLELEEIVMVDGYDSCHECHGANGVEP